jgi:hypothetical protein
MQATQTKRSTATKKQHNVKHRQANNKKEEAEEVVAHTV